MSSIAPALRQRCDVVTSGFCFSGELETGASLLRLLNQPEWVGLKLFNVTASALDPGGSGGFSQSELVVIKDYILFMAFAEAVALGTAQLLSEREKLLVYTDRFVIQALFHTSPQHNRLTNFADAHTGRWAVASDAGIHPLRPTARQAPATARRLLVNKTAIHCFHPARP